MVTVWICLKRCVEVLGREGWTREPIASRGAVRERWESLNALVKLADEIYKGAWGESG